MGLEKFGIEKKGNNRERSSATDFLTDLTDLTDRKKQQFSPGVSVDF